MNDRIETFIAMRVYVCMERGRSAWTPIRPLTPRISANVEVGIGTGVLLTISRGGHLLYFIRAILNETIPSVSPL